MQIYNAESASFHATHQNTSEPDTYVAVPVSTASVSTLTRVDVVIYHSSKHFRIRTPIWQIDAGPYGS
jgi:hypothetical protein